MSGYWPTELDQRVAVAVAGVVESIEADAFTMWCDDEDGPGRVWVKIPRGAGRVTFLEPAYESGTVVIDADGRVFQRMPVNAWQAMGESRPVPHETPRRPLRRLVLES